MRKFQLLRYLKKFRYLIVIVTLVGCLGIYYYANSNQSYSAEIVIKYTNATAEQGIAPDGREIDVTEIYSAAVITDVIADLGLNANVDQIRSGCSVVPIMSEDEQTRKEAILSEGEEYTTFTPTYKVTFRAGKTASKGYVRNVLDSIIDNYYLYYSKKYVDTAVVPNNSSNVSVGNFDYINCIEIIDGSIADIREYLNGKAASYPNFRSTETGYTFSDLAAKYDYIGEQIIPKYYATVLGGKMTRDKEALIKYYKNKRDNYNMSIENLSDHIEKERDLIDQFGNKVTSASNSVAGAIGDNSDAIIQNVQTGNSIKDYVNTSTTYDELIDYYVGLLSGKNTSEIESEYCNTILEIFDSEDVYDDTESASAKTLLANMQETIDELNTLHEDVVLTSGELNEFSAANNISTMSGTYSEEAINIDMYLLLAVVLFFVVGCAGAVLLGRLADFLEYFLYTDKKAGTANRVKCDLVIDEYSKSLVDEYFSCIVFRVNRLGNTNKSLGRLAGDALLKDFGTTLDRMAQSYGFVGYNNGDMFIALFENCSMARAEKFVGLLKNEADAYNAEKGDTLMSFSSGIAESAADDTYEIRELLQLASKRLRAM